VKRLFDIAFGMLAGAWLSAIWFGAEVQAETRGNLRDGILLVLMILLVARFVFERRQQKSINGR
jgi:hypothetical protein